MGNSGLITGQELIFLAALILTLLVVAWWLLRRWLAMPQRPAIPWSLVAFAILFAIAEVVKLVRGDTVWAIIDAVLAIVVGTASALTARFTKSADDTRRVERGRWFPAQLAACAIIFLASMFDVPAWVAFRGAVYAAAPWGLANYADGIYANGIANFVTYCVPISVILLLLRVPLWQQGLGPFKKGSLASAVAWLTLPLAIFALAVALGKVSVGIVALTWLSNLLQNGVSEEFLWRGAIMGRLRAFMTTTDAIVLQALLFGAWHFHADLRGYHGDMINAVADMIASQALFGLAAGFVTVRTGNIAIASGFHLLFDSLQIFQ